MRGLLASYVAFALLEQCHYVTGLLVFTYAVYELSKLAKKYGN
jgi:hypothetical protein